MEAEKYRTWRELMAEGERMVLLRQLPDDGGGDNNNYTGTEALCDEEIQMLEALAIDGDGESPSSDHTAIGDSTDVVMTRDQCLSQNERTRRNNTKKKKKNKKSKSKTMKNSGGQAITNVNRFVMDTCRLLKEKKSYLVWTAVCCLGVSAFQNLIKEVEIIQNFGGQQTTDGSRLRTGGGILWNILRTREPKAYKEIMAKGREFERQFRQPKTTQSSKPLKEVPPSRQEIGGKANEVANKSDYLAVTKQDQPNHSDKAKASSVLDRIRMPVAYDDLYEEGEIRD